MPVLRGPCSRVVDGKWKALFKVSTRTTDHAAACGCDPCQALAERLRRRAGLQERLKPDSLTDHDSERDRGVLPAGLEAELALLIGIELSVGGLL